VLIESRSVAPLVGFFEGEGDGELLADRVRQVLADGHDAYVYFKHEDDPRGALWAEELLHQLRP